MKRYQYILLDWDGNLARTLDLWHDAYKLALQRRGLKLSDREIAAGFGAMTEFMTEQWGIANIQEFYLEVDEIVKQKLPDVELYPDALDVLETLHEKGKQLALITTSPHYNIAHALERHNMHRFFGCIIAHDDVTHHKPHPEPLEKALAILGGDKSSAVMIGDSDKDLGAAANAGIDSILFYPDEHDRHYDRQHLETFNPTHVISDFKEVVRIAG